MKRICLVLAMTALVGGCGTLQSSYNPQDDVDVDYIAAVEQGARRHGANVIWINTPRKRRPVQ
jgi:uncharacterized protein YceK